MHIPAKFQPERTTPWCSASILRFLHSQTPPHQQDHNSTPPPSIFSIFAPIWTPYWALQSVKARRSQLHSFPTKTSISICPHPSYSIFGDFASLIAPFPVIRSTCDFTHLVYSSSCPGTPNRDPIGQRLGPQFDFAFLKDLEGSVDFAEDLGHLLLLRARTLLLLAGIGAGYWIAVSYPSPLIFGSSPCLVISPHSIFCCTPQLLSTFQRAYLR